jgi:peptidoglycan hydrolase-like protein with peptidoglycan-binding domain
MITQGNSRQQGARRRSRLIYLFPIVILVPLIAAAAFALITISSHPTIVVGPQSLAKVSLPFGGGTIKGAVAVGGEQQKVIPVRLVGNQVWPVGKLAPGEKVTVIATVKRPGWISWLSGDTQQVRITETTPTVHLVSQFVTRHHGQPVTVRYNAPVAVVASGAIGSDLTRQVLASPQTSVGLNESATAGTISVAAAARTWETLRPKAVSWFPGGAKASAVATPAPGTSISPGTPITLTMSKRVSKVLGKHYPPLSPRTQGTWERLNAHTIRFVPAGYGYGLGAQVKVDLPSDVNLVGGTVQGSDPFVTWKVPSGSTLRLQQLLATLGYLPVNFKPTGAAVASTITAQENAAVNPPAGNFTWRYHRTPAALRQMWTPGQYGELTKGAVMSFEESQGLLTDGVDGPTVWKALLQAATKDQKSTFGYSFVYVSEGSPESEQVWHNGKVTVSGPVNTGIPAAPTATGVFAVYEHIPVGTMSGKNPDGSTYHDPGIPWISYFNGGDALHGFIRASYGFPQSLGCVEMPFSEAGQVYPYTPIGTIVDVVS